MSALSKLTDVQIRQAKPKATQYKLSDGGGLHILIKPDGTKYWRYKYRFLGAERLMSLGVYPEVPAARAREAHRVARQQLTSGVDPMAARKKAKLVAVLSAETTFEGVAREFWTKQLASGRSAVYAASVVAMLEKDIFPWIGKQPIAEIETPELLATLHRAESRAAATARKLRTQVGQVFRYAIQTGKAKTDPTVHLRGALMTVKGGHFAAITTPEPFADLLRAMYAYRGELVTRCLLRLSPLVFQRPSELRGAGWDEFDLDGVSWGVPMWEIPALRSGAVGDTKITRTGWASHLVPLSNQAVSVLRTLKPLTGHTGLVFHSSRNPGNPLSSNTALSALRRLGYAGEMTAHGFRASARTMAAERLRINRDMLELQISHRVADSMGRAYDRTQFLEERIAMMQQWADYLDRLVAGGSVVPFKRVA